MKNSILLLFLFVSSIIHAQYNIDWVNAPLNPIPEKYTLNHFQLKGNVKEFNSGYGTYYFNEEGFLTKKTDILGKQTVYEYNNGQLVTIKKNGESINVKNSEGKIVNKFNSNSTVTVFKYDDKKQLMAKSKTSEGSEKEEYVYDLEGRVSESKIIYPHITIHTIFTYKYDDELLTIHAKKNGQTSRHYYKNGYYMGGVLKAKSLSFDIQGNPLSLINQNGQEYKELKYTYYEN